MNFGGSEKYSGQTTSFAFPSTLAANRFALDGAWSLQTQYAQPSTADARVRLNYTAGEVRMVLAGSGTVSYAIDGVTKTLHVSGTPNSYRLLKTGGAHTGTVTVTVPRGVQAYSFTFGG